MPPKSQDFRHNALIRDKNDIPVLGALQCGPYVVQALKSPMELSNKIPTLLPWSIRVTLKSVVPIRFPLPFLLPIKPQPIKPFPSV